MNESPPLISIIVPNYNHERFLKQRLESVFNQSYSNFEVILLDDCSTDNSREILLEYAKHPKVSCCVFNEVNSGSPFKQWENGIAFAKGEYIWIAESDDYCELDFIDNIIDAMIKDSTIGLGYCQTIDVDVNCHQIYHRINYTKYFQPNIWVDNFEMDGRQFIQLYLSFFNVIPNASAVIFRRNLVDNFFFSESLLQMKMCGDWYFWIKIALKSKVFFCKKKLNCFRNHHSVTRNHNSIHEKKKRLLEEKDIRFFMLEAKIKNVRAELNLYKKWFRLHSVTEVLLKTFYNVKLENRTIHFFIWNYLCFRYDCLKRDNN